MDNRPTFMTGLVAHPHHRLSMMGPTLLGTRAHKHTVTPVDSCDEGDEDRKRV